jgi:antitoxin HicB
LFAQLRFGIEDTLDSGKNFVYEAVEDWLARLDKGGNDFPEPPDAKKFSGKSMVRLEPSLHRRLAAKAQAEGESLNSFAG